MRYFAIIYTKMFCVFYSILKIIIIWSFNFYIFKNLLIYSFNKSFFQFFLIRIYIFPQKIMYSCNFKFFISNSVFNFMNCCICVCNTRYFR